MFVGAGCCENEWDSVGHAKCKILHSVEDKHQHTRHEDIALPATFPEDNYNISDVRSLD